jgi:hypothetical protein
MRTIGGKCHCGNITYQLEWPVADKVIAVRACGCTFCTRHGGVYTSHPDATLSARVADEGHVNRYAFGTETAEFYICTHCGAVPFVISTIDGTQYAVVNVNTFENVDPSELDASASDFDGESVADRLARRKRNWIGRVRIGCGD